MSSENKRTRGVRVFENPVADWMSRAHPAFPAVFWIPICLAVLGYSVSLGMMWYAIGGLFAAGFVLWTFFEYVLHRWIFHFVPEQKWMRRHFYLVHQIHHEHQEWDRLVAPPMMSVTLGLFFAGLFYLIFGSYWMWPIYAGFIVGYLAYDYVHFYTHFGEPKSDFVKTIRRRHLMHHHAYPNRWYGVSNHFWDFVFRTNVKKGEKPPKKERVDWDPPIIDEPAE
jgi:hypothetical protein